MPKTTKGGKAKQDGLPATLKRSPAKAQRTFAKVHDAAAESYGEGERAHRTAFAAVKHSFERSATTGSPRTRRVRATLGARSAARLPTTAGHLPPAASTPRRARSTCTSWRSAWTSPVGRR